MLGKIEIRSRFGNLVLGVLGVLYAVAASALLVYYLVQSWNAAGLIDRGLQLILFGSAVVGIWFVLIARDNLHPPHATR